MLESSRFKLAFKSILVACVLVLFGWSITTVSNTFGYLISPNEQIFELIQMYSGITVNIACSANIFVFFAINPEYRETIRSLLSKSAKIPKYLDSSNSGAPPAPNSGLLTNL
ncbi:unnamed protein product [Caenorhabditis angaria]|uniref:G-protein coupled receptors family 1 profile domain-containing protein n=1 Tax=Caenorhabditis angaria TaxID=860376 RepID=A0A9P1N4D4_9PELO|nr:unnamed protein product [Caenorhabditis angaria]